MTTRNVPRGGEHTIQRADGVLWNCARKTRVTVLPNVTPIHSTKNSENTKILTTASIFHQSPPMLIRRGGRDKQRERTEKEGPGWTGHGAVP